MPGAPISRRFAAPPAPTSCRIAGWGAPCAMWMQKSWRDRVAARSWRRLASRHGVAGAAVGRPNAARSRQGLSVGFACGRPSGTEPWAGTVAAALFGVNRRPERLSRGGPEAGAFVPGRDGRKDLARPERYIRFDRRGVRNETVRSEPLRYIRRIRVLARNVAVQPSRGRVGDRFRERAVRVGRVSGRAARGGQAATAVSGRLDK